VGFVLPNNADARITIPGLCCGRKPLNPDDSASGSK
jgi:hypothetical protein